MGTTQSAAVIRITGRSSKVTVSAAPGQVFSVEGGTYVVRDDGSIDVTPGTGAVDVKCSEHTVLVVSTASGAVTVTGPVRDLRAITSSGRVRADRIVDADVRTTSGPVEIRACEGTCRIVTRTGAVTVGDANDLSVTTTSARIRVGRVSRAALHSASGAVDVTATALAQVRVVTISGSVRITTPTGTAGTTRLVSRSGRVRNDVAPGEGVVIDATTGSGAIEVVHE